MRNGISPCLRLTLVCGIWLATAVAVLIQPRNSLAAESVNASPAIGAAVLTETFTEKPAAWTLPAGAVLADDGNGGRCLAVSAGATEGGEAVTGRDILGKVQTSGKVHLATLALEASQLKGCALDISLRVKAQAVPVPPSPWEGVRITIDYTTPVIKYNDAYHGLNGTFDWRPVNFRVWLPANAVQAKLSLGLLSDAGKAWFDDLKITIADMPLAAKTHPKGPAYKGHKLSRLRGLNTGGLDEAKIKMLTEEWNANVLKVSFSPKTNTLEELADVQAWVEANFAKIDAAVEAAKAQNVYLIVQMTDPWHVKEHGSNDLIYEDARYGEKMVEIWQTVAGRYRGCNSIYAFELFNESAKRLPVAPGCLNYEGWMERVAQAINAIDPQRAIIVQSEEWWGPRAFEKLRPLQAKNIVYAAHIYEPFAVSHQGIGEWYKWYNGGQKDADKRIWNTAAYPGEIADATRGGQRIVWNKETVRQAIQPILDFQKAYQAHIIVSEFSCIRWAPGDSPVHLIGDMIDLFEEYDWDWTYHGYPEFHGWDPTLNADPWSGRRPEGGAPTENLLKKWFKLNERPNFNQ